jgi:amino acid permease
MFLLSDFEVFISLMKFMIGVGIFIRPKMMWEAGLFNAVTSELIALAAVLISNSNLVRCLNYMPS